MKKLFLFSFLVLTSSLFSQCQKYILTSEFDLNKDKISNLYESLSKSNKEVFMQFFAKKVSNDNLVFYVRDKKNVKFKKANTEGVITLDHIEYLKPDLIMIYPEKYQSYYFMLDIHNKIAYTYPNLQKYYISFSECE